jgi:hypothetical protein
MMIGKSSEGWFLVLGDCDCDCDYDSSERESKLSPELLSKLVFLLFFLAPYLIEVGSLLSPLLFIIILSRRRIERKKERESDE